MIKLNKISNKMVTNTPDPANNTAIPVIQNRPKTHLNRGTDLEEALTEDKEVHQTQSL